MTGLTQQRPPITRQDLAQLMFHELASRSGGVRVDVLHAFRGCFLYTLDLSHCQGLDDNLASAVIAEHSRALQTLSLESGAMLSDAVLVALRGCPQLRTLSLSGCSSVTDRGVSCLRSCDCLQHVSLSGCVNISDASMYALAACRGLRSLDLNQCKGISDVGPLGGLQLQSLKLGWTAVDDESMSDVASMTSLETLVLDRTVVGDRGVATVCSGCMRLAVLCLSGCPVGNAIGPNLAALDHLREVNLSHTHFGDPGLAAWCSHSQPQMRLLNLSHTEVTGTGLRLHGEAMNALHELDLDGLLTGGEALIPFRQLRHLILADTAIMDACMEHVCNLPHLETLSLAFCAVTSASLRRWPLPASLKRLDLDTTRSISLGELVHLTRLESLTLPDGLTDSSIVLLSRFRESLTSLDLCSSSVTDAGMVHITHLVRLTRLSLSHSKITDAALLLLCASLRHLQTLNLSGTAVTDAGLQTLVDSAPAGLISVCLIGTSVTEAAVRRSAESRPSMRVSVALKQQHRLRAPQQ